MNVRKKSVCCLKFLILWGGGSGQKKHNAERKLKMNFKSGHKLLRRGQPVSREVTLNILVPFKGRGKTYFLS